MPIRLFGFFLKIIDFVKIQSKSKKQFVDTEISQQIKTVQLILSALKKV